MDLADQIAEGREAWARIRGCARKNWDDWLAVGHALVIGRSACMKAANINAPVGTRYNRLMGEWLTLNGLADTSASERYSILQIIEHLPTIEAWRAALPADLQRRYNSPSCVLNYWKRAQRPMRAPPGNIHHVGGKKARYLAERPSQDLIRYVHVAIREVWCSDTLKVAAAASAAVLEFQSQQNLAPLCA